jgi:hypothetical protein
MLSEQPLCVTVHWKVVQPETDQLPARLAQEPLVLDEQ